MQPIEGLMFDEVYNPKTGRMEKVEPPVNKSDPTRNSNIKMLTPSCVEFLSYAEKFNNINKPVNNSGESR